MNKQECAIINYVSTSKGNFQMGMMGGGKEYEVNKISECCLGYFILKEDGKRDYFTKNADILKIRAFRETGINSMIRNEFIGNIQEITKEPIMLTKWDNEQNKLVKQKIKKMFFRKVLKHYDGTRLYLKSWNEIENFLGLPYTSSSLYAILGVTNTNCYVDIEEKHNINGFTMGVNGKVYVHTNDWNSHEKIFELI